MLSRQVLIPGVGYRAPPGSYVCLTPEDGRPYTFPDSPSFPKAQSGVSKEEALLAEVIVGEHESFESALKRFTKKVQQDGILAEARRREHYEKPSIRRKKKAAAKRRKSRKAAA
jgi:small subunit ribosomal protein S21